MASTVCVFGIYDREYAHNRMLIQGLQENGYEIIECHVDPKEFSGITKYRELGRLAKNIKKQEGENGFSCILVLFPGHTVVWLARLLFRNTPIVFDAFVSLYDSNVCDRKTYSDYSIHAVRDWFLDWSSTTLASKVLLDTHAHIEYFVKTFGTKADKCIRVPISSDPEIFYPRNSISAPEPFIVHFHGTYIPLQGIPYIIEAARHLRNQGIVFRIIGSTHESKNAGTIQSNAQDLVSDGTVEFINALPYAALADAMASASICLGIFGDTDKAQRVIPNKVYEALAMGKPIITADTPAVRELLSEDAAYLIPSADPEALATAILDLKDHPEKRTSLGTNATSLFQAKLLPQHIVKDMIESLNLAIL